MTKQLLPPYLRADTIVTSQKNHIVIEVSLNKLAPTIKNLLAHTLTFKMFDASQENENSTLWYVFGDLQRHLFIIVKVTLGSAMEFDTITDIVPAAQKYEDKVYESFGLLPLGRDVPRSLVLHENWPENIHPLSKSFDWNRRPKIANGVYEFKKIGGEGIYEIPVGPIHAGIIEPGHFRFSVAGEEIVNLEPRLGYTHKGSEKLFEQLALPDQVRLSEKISGDTSYGHSLAYCQAVEYIADIEVSEEVATGRVLLAELERLANHFNDIGAIMLDAGFNFGGTQGARLREAVMRINDALTGSRFLRGMNVVGGLNLTLTPIKSRELLAELHKLKRDFQQVISVAENTVTLLNRIKGTGVVPNDAAEYFEIVGVTARASGKAIDSRLDFPYAAYAQFANATIPTENSGDVYARFRVRIAESLQSFAIIEKVLETGISFEPQASTNDVQLPKNSVSVGCVEGWRGEILYLVCTNSQGKIHRVAVRDPSFVNWQVVSETAFGEMVPDFPLINKSFNLSYSGHDL